MAIKKTQKQKQIVYLIGAGATQAEADYIGARPINLLMKANDIGEGVSTRILRNLDTKWRQFLGQDHSVDIEKLISLLTASGSHRLGRLAESMRKHYFSEILKSLVDSRVIDQPTLAIGLFKLHSDTKFSSETETLSGVLTTNHDGLFQVASQRVFGSVNLGFPFVSDVFTAATSETVPPILQLHGSFTWKLSVPIKVNQLKAGEKYAPETVWIPPTVLKESKNYPFNKMMGIAYELLAKRCDVLRVIGSSLTPNDWNVLSLIFNAQRHRELYKGSAFRVELILPPSYGDSVQKECTYLKNVIPVKFLTEGRLAEYKEEESTFDVEMRNVFAFWLKEKIQHHANREELTGTAMDPVLAEIVGELA